MDVGFFALGFVSALVAALFFLSAWGYGVLLASPFRLSGVDRTFAALALGTGALGYLAFALGLVGLLRPLVLAGVLLGGVALLFYRHRAHVRHAWEFVVGTVAATTRAGLPRWSALMAGVAVLFALIGALLPETEYDALWYHLAFPARYVRSGWLLDMPCERMSPTPQHVEILYSFALLLVDVGSLPDGRAAKLIHFGFGILAAAWTALVAARLVGRRWAVLAAALVLTAPVFLWEMTTAYNELPLAFLGIGSIATLFAWRATRQRRLLALAGLLVGFGLAGKHLAFFFLVPFCAMVFLTGGGAGRRSVAGRLQDVALFAGVALVVPLPWYVRAWYYTGNPLFPMFYDLLAGLGLPLERWDENQQRAWTSAMGEYGHGRTLADLILLPLRMLIYPREYAGSTGPAWFLFLPLLPLFWTRLSANLRWLVFVAVVYCALWVSPYSSFQVRYLVPVLPALSLLVVAAIHHFEEAARRAEWPKLRTVAGALVLATLLFNLPVLLPAVQPRSSGASSTLRVKLSTIRGLVRPDQYARWRVDLPALRHVNSHLPPDAKVVKFGWPVHFYSRPDVVFDWSDCVSAATWGARAGEEAAAYQQLRAAGVTHIMWDRRVDQDTKLSLAVGTATFRTYFSGLVYSDDGVEIFELSKTPRANSVGAANFRDRGTADE